MVTYISKIQIFGLHEKFDIQQDLNPELNIFYGKNGEFKTTVLSVIANALNGEYARFMHIEFNRIYIYFDDGTFLSLKWSDESREVLLVSRSDKRRERGLIEKLKRDSKEITSIKKIYNSEKMFLSVAYFPTFRSILEAWFSSRIRLIDLEEAFCEDEKIDESEKLQKKCSNFIREMFGDFTPDITFMPLAEIIKNLEKELNENSLLLAQSDQELLSLSFSNVFRILTSSDFSENLSEPCQEDPIINSNYESIVLSIKRKLETISLYSFYYNNNPLLTEVKKRIYQAEDALTSIRGEVNSSKVQILKIYENLLKDIESQLFEYFGETLNYIESINKFLKDKKLEIDSEKNKAYEPFIKLSYSIGEYSQEDDFVKTESDDKDNNDKNDEKGQKDFFEKLNLDSIKSFSSGERQIFSLLFASHVSDQSVILVDEPEISLHVSWQEALVEEMFRKMEGKQLIICTHSPFIGKNYIKKCKSMDIRPTDPDSWSFGPESYLPENEETQEKSVYSNDKEDWLEEVSEDWSDE